MPIKFKKITLPTPYPVGPVHVYYFVINGNRILFDAGPPTEDAIKTLQNSIELTQLDYLFITHFHPDHYGAAHLIEKISPAQIIFSKYDLAIYEIYDQRVSFFFDYLHQLKVPNQLTLALKKTFSVLKRAIPLPKSFQILEDSQKQIEELGISYLQCPGHSQSDIVYLFDEFAITGDTLLRDIFQTPLLDLDFTTMKNRYLNYENYCSSIPKLKSIAHRRILTAHNENIRSVNYQIRFYYYKILEKVEKLAPLLEKGTSLFQIMTTLYPHTESRPFLFYMKLSEFLFLKDYLENPDLLENILKKNNIIEQ